MYLTALPSPSNVPVVFLFITRNTLMIPLLAVSGVWEEKRKARPGIEPRVSLIPEGRANRCTTGPSLERNHQLQHGAARILYARITARTSVVDRAFYELLPVREF